MPMVITSRRGCDRYLVSHEGWASRERLGQWAGGLESIAYGEHRTINGVRISLHPAGHILGSAQIRVEYRGEVWVASGDYKTDPDPTCAPWGAGAVPYVHHRKHLRSAHLPMAVAAAGIRRHQRVVGAECGSWAQFLALRLCAGKAQRLLAGLDASIGPILTHGAVERMTALYRSAGVTLPGTRHASDALRDKATIGAMLIAPPSAAGTSWLRRFGDIRTAFASGWMRVRGARRQRGMDAGFTLSDHVDWPQLLAAIDATGAEQVWVTHGFTNTVVQWLTEQGRDAHVLPTRWGDEEKARDDDASGGDASSDNAPGGDAPTAEPIA